MLSLVVTSLTSAKETVVMKLLEILSSKKTVLNKCHQCHSSVLTFLFFFFPIGIDYVAYIESKYVVYISAKGRYIIYQVCILYIIYRYIGYVSKIGIPYERISFFSL